MSDEKITGTKESSDDWAAAIAEQENSALNSLTAKKNTDIPKVKFEDLEPENIPYDKLEEANLDVILDIPVTISMEIGRTQISIRNLLQLNQGSVIELDRVAGEPMDVLVNGTLIAHGEVVVVNEQFGIRLTDVISAAERVKKLK